MPNDLQPHRRIYQLSIRGMFLLVTAIALFLAVLAMLLPRNYEPLARKIAIETERVASADVAGAFQSSGRIYQLNADGTFSYQFTPDCGQCSVVHKTGNWFIKDNFIELSNVSGSGYGARWAIVHKIAGCVVLIDECGAPAFFEMKITPLSVLYRADDAHTMEPILREQLERHVRASRNR